VIKFSICNKFIKDWSLERIFEHVAALGYNGLEIAPYTIAESVTKRSRKQLLEILRITCRTWRSRQAAERRKTRLQQADANVNMENRR